MEEKDKEYIFCEDVNNAILAYLDHAKKKLEKEPNYDVHPIMRAIIAALDHREDKDDKFIGIAGSKVEIEASRPTELYAAIVEVNKEIIKILEIKDLVTGNVLSVYDALLIIEFNLKLEKIKSDTLKAYEIERLLNETFDDINFIIVCPDNFEEARDYFREVLIERKIHFSLDGEIIKALSEIKASTPWEEYKPDARALISCVWGLKEGKRGIPLASNEITKEEAIILFKMLFTGQQEDEMLQFAKKSQKINN